MHAEWSHLARERSKGESRSALLAVVAALVQAAGHATAGQPRRRPHRHVAAALPA